MKVISLGMMPGMFLIEAEQSIPPQLLKNYEPTSQFKKHAGKEADSKKYTNSISNILERNFHHHLKTKL
jgi:hypothetical protein